MLLIYDTIRYAARPLYNIAYPAIEDNSTWCEYTKIHFISRYIIEIISLICVTSSVVPLRILKLFGAPQKSRDDRKLDLYGVLNQKLFIYVLFSILLLLCNTHICLINYTIGSLYTGICYIIGCKLGTSINKAL